VSTDLFRAPPSGSLPPFRTLELGATGSYDSDAFARLSVRAAAARGAGPDTFRLYAADADSAGGGGWGHFGWRVWWEPPARLREEVTYPGGQPHLVLVRDGVGSVYLPAERTLYTNAPIPPGNRRDVMVPGPNHTVELPTIRGRLAQFPLIRSPLPASEWSFEAVGQGEVYAGRVTRRVRATRRPGAAQTDETEACGWLWPWLNEYECLVDDALQILVRITGIADGAPVVAVAADEVHVDEMLSPDLFTFGAPPGTRVVHLPWST
jgi:hypothetical protein